MNSMTGFGRGACATAELEFTVEISTVNRKQLELRLNLPTELMVLEVPARQRVGEFFSRGSVQLRAAWHKSGTSSGPEVDTALLQRLVQTCVESRRQAGLPTDAVQLENLLSLPGVLKSPAVDPDSAAVRDAFFTALTQACENCLAMRRAEGKALQRELSGRGEVLRGILAEIKGHLPELENTVRTRLEEKLAAAQLPVDQRDPAFLREMLFYTDHADVTEETVRLESHFRQLDGYLNSAEPCGRNLDFLAQEMFREINTLGNKAGNSSVSPLVVRFKSELEKLREQIQNVE